MVGEDNLDKYGVLLFTNGVVFKNDSTETFDGYLEREISDYNSKGYQNLPQTECLGKLIVDVNRRCVIFDNDDPSCLSDVEVLVSRIDHMMYVNQYGRYTKPHLLAKRRPAIILLSVVLSIVAGIIIVILLI